VVATLALAVLEGNAMQRRYASSARDLAARAFHWQDGWRMMDRTPAAWLAGMGLGRYPATYFMRSGEGIAPSCLARWDWPHSARRCWRRRWRRS
jgi:hypothetical protein